MSRHVVAVVLVAAGCALVAADLRFAASTSIRAALARARVRRVQPGLSPGLVTVLGCVLGVAVAMVGLDVWAGR